MDAHDLHTKPQSLLDKIAADPDMINRPLPGTAPTPTAHSDESAASGQAPAVVLLHPDEHFPAAAPAAHGHKLVLLLITAGVILVVSGGGAVAYFSFRPAPAAVTATHSPSPTPSPSISPTATPEPTPEPTPTPLPTGSIPYGPTSTPLPTTTPKAKAVLSASDISPPAAEPTASNPQTVTVTNPSGLWLRSTPNSSNKGNIIAWMPKGAQVSVDSIGEYWWHGTYKGKAGYFAVNYTE